MYTVYQTTCLKNSKIYIGVHKTDNPNDNYIGSGSYLKRAIRKHGIENFKKEVLYVFEYAEEAYQKEAELVTKEFLVSGKSYNLKLGGEGGWDLQNTGSFSHKERCRKAAFKSNEVRTIESRSKVAKKAAKTVKERYGSKFGEMISESIKNSEICKNILKERKACFSEESNVKRKLTFAKTGHQKGDKNSSYGTMWITDGINNKKIQKTDPIPEHWKKGRIL